MPYILPQDTATRQLGALPAAAWIYPTQRRTAARRPVMASSRRMPPQRRYLYGDYTNQRFVIPTNSLGQPIIPHTAAPHMAGAFVDATWQQPPYRQTMGQSFLDEETIGVKNKYLLGGGLLALLLLGRGKR